LVLTIVCLTARDGKDLYVWKVTADQDEGGSAFPDELFGLVGFCVSVDGQKTCQDYSDACDHFPDVSDGSCNMKDNCKSVQSSGVGLEAFYVLVLLAAAVTFCLAIARCAKGSEGSLQFVNGYLSNTAAHNLRRWSNVSQTLMLLFSLGAVGAEICLGAFSLSPGCDSNGDLELHAGAPVVLTSLLVISSIASLCSMCCCRGTEQVLLVSNAVDTTGLVCPAPTVQTYPASGYVSVPPPMPPTVAPPNSGLPPGWRQFIDQETGKAYYQQPNGQVTWDAPQTLPPVPTFQKA